MADPQGRPQGQGTLLQGPPIEWDATGKPIKFGRPGQTPQTPPANVQTTPEHMTPGDVTEGVWSTLDPIPLLKMLKDNATSPHPELTPIVTAINILKPLLRVPGAARMLAEGRYEDAANEFSASIPMLGPMAEESSRLTKSTDPHERGRGYGQVLGTVAAPFLGEGVARLGVGAATKAGNAFRNVNPVARDAVEWGMNQGIPVDAGTASGNYAVRGAQWLADRSLGGAYPAAKAEQRTADAMKTAGQDLASRSLPRGATPVTAGEAVEAGTKASKAQYAAEEFRGYEKFKQIAAQFKQKVRIVVNMTEQGTGRVIKTPTTVEMAMPVNVKNAKTMLKPIYDEIRLLMPVAQEEASVGLKAIKNILDEADFMPAVMVDKNLSAIKRLARTSEGVSGGLSSQAVRTLEAELQKAVAKGGRPAQEALAAGRKAHIQGVRADELLDAFHEEPAQIFRNLTQSKDAWLYRLRAVAREAPQAMPQLARAFLDDLLETATKSGKFDRNVKIARTWDNLGEETKKLLFPDAQHRSDLNNFFRLASEMATNPNPSGSAFMASLGAQGTLLVYNPVTGVPVNAGLGALSQLLHNPKAVRALTEGLTTPITAGNKGKAITLFQTLSRALESEKESRGASGSWMPAAAPGR